MCTFWDHPHACGDKVLQESTTYAMSGSSPRVWGQVNSSKILFHEAGIIPTRVGTSIDKLGGENSDRDHPHACGDKLYNFHTIQPKLGSSPRVWGQVIICKLVNGNVRIIPTRVGTSDLISPIPTRKGDHPHACGDKLTPSFVICFKLGSSPRVWGQASKSMSAGNITRIIPTRVGTSQAK